MFSWGGVYSSRWGVANMSVNVKEKINGSGEWWVFINHKGKRKAKKVGSYNAARIVKEYLCVKFVMDDLNIPFTKEEDKTYKRVVEMQEAEKIMKSTLKELRKSIKIKRKELSHGYGQLA